jgi:lipopolysaccharide transport protein LptA/LPS export ABC transporter protein LptC
VKLLERARRDPARAVRQGLLALVVVVSASVAWSLLRSKPAAVEPLPSPSPGATGTTVGELTFLRFKDESRRIEVKAKEMVGSQEGTMILHGVEATLPYVREGKPGTVTITADECQYQQAIERAAFKGNVVLRTDDGFELESATLKYWGDKERAFSADPIHFKRGAIDGTALGFEYRAGSGVELRGDVRIKVTPPGGVEPTHIASPSATASREERRITFHDGAVARQGARELRGNELRLALDESLDRIERAVVTGNVDLLAGPGTSLAATPAVVAPAAPPGAAPPAGGSQRLRSQKLEVDLGPAGELKQALATGSATLDVEPGPNEPKERRRLAGPRLRFDFDAEGRLASVHGLRAAARPGPKDRPVLTAEPLEGAEGAPRRVESEAFDATLDPATGELVRAEFDGSVAFSEPGRKAFAGHAVHDVAAGTIVLTREPRIVDEAEGSELRGREIRIGTRTRAVTASGTVRHEVRGKGRRAGLFGVASAGAAQPAAPAGPAAGSAAKNQEPTVIVCREFDYDPQARRARYRENALMRSGQDEVRAPLITLDEPGPGERRMKATGGVTSVLHPQPAKGGAKEPEPVETRSKEMVYEEAKRQVVYSGDVEIRQGDILTKSPEAVVLLAKDGETVDRMLAGEPVEVHQGIKRAKGERGTYTPANETFVLVGERVVLHDADRRLEGRMLTFEVGSDRIRVDGREEVRTEAVFRRKELQRP